MLTDIFRPIHASIYNIDGRPHSSHVANLGRLILWDLVAVTVPEAARKVSHYDALLMMFWLAAGCCEQEGRYDVGSV